LVKGEVRTDPVTRALYSTAACIYRVVPIGVVCPRSQADVSAVLKYGAERGIPVTARGAGSGVAGQSLGRGLILDFSRHMDRVIEVDVEDRSVRVEPGVVYAALNRRLRRYGLIFPPDPSSGDFCTIGGMLANNSGGAHSVMYGTVDDHVVSSTVFLPGGEELVAGKYSLDGGVIGDKVRAAADILKRNEQAIAGVRPVVTKNASGYNVWEVFDGGTFDLARLMVGSEGTLGIFTEARLRLVKRPNSRATAMYCFSDLEGMTRSIREIKQSGPSTIELMDRSLLDVLVGSDYLGLLKELPDGLEALLLVEFSGVDGEEVAEKASDCLREVRPLCMSEGYRVAVDEPDQERLWEIRNRASTILRLVDYPCKPLRFIEDAAVPVENLPEYISRLRSLLAGFGVRAAIFGHAGDGNVHVNPLIDLTRGDYKDVIAGLAGEVVSIVSDLGGTLSGEHGDGRLRSPFLPRIYGGLCDVFREIKRVFDPVGILNPGIIVDPESETITADLRYDYTSARDDLSTDPGRLKREVDKCHGCGTCRVYCPPFMALGTEEATARAKANLVREYLIGELIADDTINSPLCREVMNLCYNCKLCTTECPSRVDIPWLAVQARSAIHKVGGFSVEDRFLMASGEVERLGSKTPRFSNRMLANGLLRMMMEGTVGIHHMCMIPRFDTADPLDGAGDRHRDRGEVVYFPGCFATYHSRVGEYAGTLNLLEAMGYRARMLEGDCCGVARLTIGDIDGFRKRAHKLVERYEEVSPDGADVVFSSPSCLVCVREEYPRYLGDEGAGSLAAHTVDILELVDRQADMPWSYGPMANERDRVILQIPCHLRSLGLDRLFVRVMEGVPGIHLVDVSDRCCGLAGTFGMRKERFDLSMEIGSALFKELEDRHDCEVVTPCGACRLQIAQGTSSNPVHPVELLSRCLMGQNSSDQRHEGSR
jgi:FAD/FMN-containing dehydrogenase/Fe-S oxidoreductase